MGKCSICEAIEGLALSMIIQLVECPHMNVIFCRWLNPSKEFCDSAVARDFLSFYSGCLFCLGGLLAEMDM